TSLGPQIQDQADNLDKRGLKVTFEIAPEVNYQLKLAATGEVPVYDDLTSVHAVSNVPRNAQYTVTSLKTEAQDAQLRTAGTDYEQWVKDRYLSLPATVPQRVRDLARQVVQQASATNPYDQARATEPY